MRNLTRLAVGLLSVAAMAMSTATVTASAAPTAVPSASTPQAPKGLVVTRGTNNPHELAISWKPVPGINNYMVRVNDGTKDSNLIIPAEQTSTVFRGQGECTTYRVSVSAAISKDSMGTTGTTFVPSLAPGGVSATNATRSENGSAGVVSWAPPKNPGASPVTRYSVRVSQLSNGHVIHSADQAHTSLSLRNLDPARMYVAKVTAGNSFGGCITSTQILGNNRPSSPTFTVSRAPGQPAAAVVNWKPGDWAGYGNLTGYRIGYKRITDKAYSWTSAKSTDTSVTIPALDPTVNWTFVMRGVNGDMEGLLSKPYVLTRSGYNPVTARVDITGGDDSIAVDFSAPVGSSTNYPVARVDVARANGTAGWTDRHQVTNGTGRVTFDPVPCGTYNVVVTGVGATSSQEMLRMKARVCEPAPICFVSTLTNGGFETPAIPNSSYRILPASTSGLEWSNSAESFVELWSTGFSNSSNGKVTAAEGRQFAELNANKAGTLYQDLPTTPGTTMRWHLNHRGRAGNDTMRVMVGKPGGQLTQSGSDLTTGNTAWVQYTGTYKIPAGQTTTRFAFEAVRTASSISVGNFLDDVVFTPEACQ